MKNKTLLDPVQIESSKPGYKNLYEQLEFGRFTSVKSGAAPTLYQEVVSTEGQSIFTLLNGTYTLGDNSLQVYVNGMLMRIGGDNDYVEVDNQTIQFNFGLVNGDVVVFRVNGGTSGPSLHENHKAVSGQLVFNLSTSYTTGNHSLVVYVNGAYQTLGIDYSETDAKRVTFVEPLEQNDLVSFRVEGLPSIENKYKNNNIVQTFDTNERLIRKEIFGDQHIIHEFEYATDGKPSRMVTKEGGYTITKTYTWSGRVCTEIITTVQEGV